MENQVGMSNYKWYTKEEIASLCGVASKSLSNILSAMTKFGFHYERKTKNIGGHKNIRLYPETVLKAIKEWQVKNNVIGKTAERKEIAVSGNISVIKNKAARQTIDSLMDNPDTLQLMLTASIERQQKLLLENSKLKESNKALSIEKETLRITLDESKEWYSAKRMEKLNQGQRFSWRLLKNESRRLGVPVKKVFDQNYGEVNAYHIAVWESLYFDTLSYAD